MEKVARRAYRPAVVSLSPRVVKWGKLVLASGLLGLAVTYFVVAWRFVPSIEDFAGFYLAGSAAARGLAAYSSTPPSLPGVTDRGLYIPWPPGSPPFALFLFQAFTVAPFRVAERAWLAVSMVAYLTMVILLARGCPKPNRLLFAGWALSAMAVFQTLGQRQTYLLTALLVAGAVAAWSRDKRIIAALCVGVLVAFKPNYGLWPLAMVAAGDLAIGLAALAWAALATVAAAIAYGPPIYVAWLSASATFVDYVPISSSVFSLGAVVGHPELSRAIGLPIAAGLCLGLLAWARLARPSRHRVALAALAISLLASPLAWPGNLVVFVPLVAVETSRRRALTIAVLLMPLLPVFIPLAGVLGVTALADPSDATVRHA